MSLLLLFAAVAGVTASASGVQGDSALGTSTANGASLRTASIVPGLYLLEIQAEAGGQRTTYERVEIEIQKALIP